MAARGVELRDDEHDREVCELTLGDGLTLNGETRLVIAWLRDVGLEGTAIAVADAHWTRKFHDAETPLLKQWLGGDVA